MSIQVSVIIPCYNHGAYIEKAISSVLEYKNLDEIEIIVINDGSTDFATIEILSKINHPIVKVIQQENQGLAKSRNNGIRLAKGRYILPLDSDNYISPEYISEAKALLDRRDDISIIFSDRIVFFDSDQRSFVEKVADFDFENLLIANTIDACAVFRRSLWEKIGGYDENMPVMGFEDWDFWIMSHLSDAKFHKINKPLFYYRDLPNSMLKGIIEKQELAFSYLLHKHSLVYARVFLKMRKENKYIKRKPLIYFIRKIIGKTKF